MNFIYDILLNFHDCERIIEFYEWNEKDYVEHIKKIPIYRITSKTMHEICENEVSVSKEFLKEIENKTISYQKSQNLKYATIVCDLNKAIALEFSDTGKVISKSSLLIDEEEDILEETTLLEEKDLKYKILKKYKLNYYLKREELFNRNYLLKELEYISKLNDYLKLNFIYEEIYKRDNYSFEKKLKRLVNDIQNNFNDKHHKLYEIIRLTYIKK